VFLNDTLFSLEPGPNGAPGKVRVTDATQQHAVRQIEWRTHQGGQGLNRIGPEGPFNRCSDTAFDTRYPGHLVSNGALVETNPTLASVPVSGTPLLGELDGLLVAAVGTAIHSYVDGVAWTSRGTVGGTPVDVKNGNLGGTEYLIYAYTSGYSYADAIGTWANKTVNVVNVEFHDYKLFGIDATGQCWFNLTINGTVENIAKISLSHGEVVTGLFKARTKSDNNAEILYATTSQRLYALNFGQHKFDEITDIDIGENNELGHERPATTFKGKIYLASGRSIIEWDPVNLTVDYIGFDLDDGLPAGVDGRITAMVASTNELFVATKAVKSGTDVACIMAWNGQGWRRVYTENDGTEVVDSIHVSRVPNTGIAIGVEYLFIGTTDRVHFFLINNSQSRPNNINSYVGALYGGSELAFNQHILPIYSDPSLTTVALRLAVQVLGASSTVGLKVQVEFEQAGQTQMTNPQFTTDSIFDETNDRVEAAGTVTFVFPTGANNKQGTEFTDIQIAVEGSATTDSKALDVLSILLDILEVEDIKESFEFTIDIRDEADGLPVEELRAKYVAIKALKTLFELTFRDDNGNTRNYWVKFVAAQGDEDTGFLEEGLVRVRAEVK